MVTVTATDSDNNMHHPTRDQLRSPKWMKRRRSCGAAWRAWRYQETSNPEVVEEGMTAVATYTASGPDAASAHVDAGR